MITLITDTVSDFECLHLNGQMEAHFSPSITFFAHLKTKRTGLTGTQVMPELLKAAKKADIPAKYVLFDSWFSSPSTLHAVKSIGYNVIGMVKKTPKMFFWYNGEDMSLITIYNQNKKGRCRSKYLLSMAVDVVKDGEMIPAKVVYVRNRNKKKKYLCLISTDTTLYENEIIRIYGKRWDRSFLQGM